MEAPAVVCEEASQLPPFAVVFAAFLVTAIVHTLR